MPSQLKPKYRPEQQRPFCCVPATLRMILRRRGFEASDQEAIGADLGLRLPEKLKSIFRHSGIKFLKECPAGGFGTRIEQSRFSIGRFFRKQGLPLKISRLRVFHVSGKIEPFLVRNISLGNDVILRFHNGLFRADRKGFGHFALVSAYDPKSRKATLADPEPPFQKEISLDEIVAATSRNNDGIQRGFYVVSKK